MSVEQAVRPSGRGGVELAAAAPEVEAVRELGLRSDPRPLREPESAGGRAEGLELLTIAGRVRDAPGVLLDERREVRIELAPSAFAAGASGREPPTDPG